jgi:hypothetical protein
MQLQADMFKGKQKLTSFSDPSIEYEVDCDELTCTCPAFTKNKKGKPCKHLLFLLPELRPVYPRRPNATMAMSALIKSQRMRNVEDMVYWLWYLWSFPDQRYRLRRRLMIMVGEDGLSMHCWERMYAWFCQGDKGSLLQGAAELVRVCKTPNWWGCPDGHRYIGWWREAMMLQEMPTGKDVGWEQSWQFFEKAVLADDSLMAVYWFGEANKVWPKGTGKEVIEDMYALAKAKDAKQAMQSIATLRPMAKLLNYDFNFTGQAVHRMFEPLGEQGPVKVMKSEVVTLLEQAEVAWQDPKPIKPHYCDGIHTSGSDRRFAGIVPAMWGCCKAFQQFGRLHEDDKWPSHFWKL